MDYNEYVERVTATAIRAAAELQVWKDQAMQNEKVEPSVLDAIAASLMQSAQFLPGFYDVLREVRVGNDPAQVPETHTELELTQGQLFFLDSGVAGTQSGGDEDFGGGGGGGESFASGGPRFERSRALHLRHYSDEFVVHVNDPEKEAYYELSAYQKLKLSELLFKNREKEFMDAINEILGKVGVMNEEQRRKIQQLQEQVDEADRAAVASRGELHEAVQETVAAAEESLPDDFDEGESEPERDPYEGFTDKAVEAAKALQENHPGMSASVALRTVLGTEYESELRRIGREY